MPRKLMVAAAGLALLGALAGCSSKKLTLDPSFTVPEGTRSSGLELMTFLDAPNSKIRMLDNGRIGRMEIGADTVNTDQIMRDDDGNLLITPIQQYLPGTVRGLVLNRTAAEGIEIFRAEPNGAVQKIFDFALQPKRRWLDGQSSLYEFVDDDPHRAPGATYYARGLIGGVAGKTSPVSNASRAVPTAITQIRYMAERWGTPGGNSNFFDADSNFFMAWTPVPGASRYLIQVFQYQSSPLPLRERILTGTPAPILTFGARDIFVASLPASGLTEYKMGDPGATIYTFRTPHKREVYYVRISAINSDGQLIGMTTGPTITRTSDLRPLYRWPLDESYPDVFADFTDAEVAGASPPAYLMYSRGAVWVSPGANPNPLTAMRRSR